jgi:hypothetical protein|tara:strand:+ start:913 stop:1134 length:222 start_codon:yes stop_codon:yes gene_type:complete
VEYKGKKIGIGDSVKFATGLNDRGENNYSNGVVTSFSGDSKTMYVHVNLYGKTPKYIKVRHEEIFNVIEKERK